MANIEKYNAAFIEVFGVTEEVLNESFSKENTEEWDSVHQLNIISAEFNLQMQQNSD